MAAFSISIHRGYNYNATNDTITSNGFIVAGNNPLFPTKGVSDSTLTGRQWGLAPRARRGLESEDVQRQGCGSRRLGLVLRSRRTLHLPFSGICLRRHRRRPVRRKSDPAVGESAVLQSLMDTTTCSTFENPWGTSLGPGPSGNPADLVLPNAAAIATGPRYFPSPITTAPTSSPTR